MQKRDVSGLCSLLLQQFLASLVSSQGRSSLDPGLKPTVLSLLSQASTVARQNSCHTFDGCLSACLLLFCRNFLFFSFFFIFPFLFLCLRSFSLSCLQLQVIRNMMNVGETEVDSQILAMFYSLLNTKACRREGRFYRRAIRKLPGWRHRRGAGGKEEEEKQKVYWKYLLTQFSVYWFAANPRRCEEILYPSSSSPAQRPVKDSRRKKCQLLDLTARLRMQIASLTDAIAKQDSPRATAIADNLPNLLKQTKPTLADLAEANVKIAAGARSVSLFRKSLDIT